MTQKAIALDDGHSIAHGVMGQLYCFKREYDKAIAEGERAVALDPSGSMVHVLYAMILTYAERSEEAIPLLKKAIRLNPFGPAWYFTTLGHAYQSTGRFEEAVSVYKTAVERAPNNFHAHLGLAASYIMMGREKEALAEGAEVLRVNPNFSLDSWTRELSAAYRDQSVIDNFIGALRRAGLK